MNDPTNLALRRNAQWLEGAAHGRKQALTELETVQAALLAPGADGERVSNAMELVTLLIESLK